MEQILTLLESASKNIRDAECTLEEISKKENLLDFELAQIKELNNKYKKMSGELKQKRVNFIRKLCLAFSETVGEKTYRFSKQSEVSRLTILPSFVGAHPDVSFQHSSDPHNRSRLEGPEFFAEHGYEGVYHSFCYWMIEGLKEYFKKNLPRDLEQSNVLKELLQEVSSLSET